MVIGFDEVCGWEPSLLTRNPRWWFRAYTTQYIGDWESKLWSESMLFFSWKCCLYGSQTVSISVLSKFKNESCKWSKCFRSPSSPVCFPTTEPRYFQRQSTFLSTGLHKEMQTSSARSAHLFFGRMASPCNMPQPSCETTRSQVFMTQFSGSFLVSNRQSKMRVRYGKGVLCSNCHPEICWNSERDDLKIMKWIETYWNDDFQSPRTYHEISIQ